MVTELKRGMTNVVKAIITSKDHQILRNMYLAPKDFSCLFKKVFGPYQSKTNNNHNLKNQIIFPYLFLQAISILLKLAP